MGINKPNQNRIIVPRLKDEKLLEQILCGKYLLIIGSEAVLKKDLPGTDETGDSNVLFYNKLLNNKVNAKGWNESQWHSFFRKNAIYQKNIEIIEEEYYSNQEYNLDNVCTELYDLLKTKQFPLVFTTCTDGYLEELLYDIYGDSLEIVNFLERGSLDSFYNEIERQKSELFYQIPPTLFYVFGKINYSYDGQSKTPFVFSEDDAVEIISQWIKLPHSHEKLYNFITPKKIMSIGCKFDDWRFRFFWYSIRHKISALKEGTVAITFNDTESEQNLKEYLIHEEIHVEPDSRKFMKHLFEILSPQNNFLAKKSYENLLKSRRSSSGYIFLSYAHEDFRLVYDIFIYLQEKNFNVWLDNKNLYSNDEYEEIIKEAIGGCSVFVPILTSQTKKDLTEKNFTRFYIEKEWKMALDRKQLGSMHFLPLSSADYNKDSDYHKEFEKLWKIDCDGKRITIEDICNINHAIEQLDRYLK